MSTFLRSTFWVTAPLLVGYVAASLSGNVTFAAGQARTAPAPKFDQATLDVFFTDARTKLGPGQPGAVRVTPAGPGAPGPGAPGGDAPVAGAGQWSKLIAAESIEGEIKAQYKVLDEMVKSPVAFKGGGNTQARYAFSMLTVLFGVISTYDGDVRWKKDAQGMQMACARAADNCKTSSDNAFKEAKSRTDNLKELIAGQTPADLPKFDPDKKWPDLVHVPPLMQRLETSQKERLGPWTGSKAEVDKNVEALKIEGDVLAVIGKMIQQEGFDNADAEDYKGWATLLQTAGKELSEAAKTGDADKAKTAVTNIGKACTDCHGAYR